jgi:hypothetical protein
VARFEVSSADVAVLLAALALRHAAMAAAAVPATPTVWTIAT